MKVSVPNSQRKSGCSCCLHRNRLSDINRLGLTLFPKATPIWLLFLSVIFVQNAFGHHHPPMLFGTNRVVHIEDGLTLYIYPNGYAIDCELPDYQMLTDTVPVSDLSSFPLFHRRQHIDRYNLLGDPSLMTYGIATTNDNLGNYAPPSTDFYVETQNKGLDITITPTLANDRFTINYSDNISVQSISLTDLSGRVIKNISLNDTLNVDVSDVPNGVYFVNILLNNGNIKSTRIIINH